jgi:hypothetical protein
LDVRKKRVGEGLGIPVLGFNGRKQLDTPKTFVLGGTNERVGVRVQAGDVYRTPGGVGLEGLVNGPLEFGEFGPFLQWFKGESKMERADNFGVGGAVGNGTGSGGSR